MRDKPDEKTNWTYVRPPTSGSSARRIAPPLATSRKVRTTSPRATLRPPAKGGLGVFGVEVVDSAAERLVEEDEHAEVEHEDAGRRERCHEAVIDRAERCVDVPLLVDLVEPVRRQRELHHDHEQVEDDCVYRSLRRQAQVALQAPEEQDGADDPDR